MTENLTVRFLLWVYLLLLGFIIIITTVIFAMYYNSIVMSTIDVTNTEAHRAAVETFGVVAQSFSDLVKVTVGAVIGALGATLQSILSKRVADDENRPPVNQDESRAKVSTEDNDNKK
jgi:hypothetical protein